MKGSSKVFSLFKSGHKPELVRKTKFVHLIKEPFDDEFTEVFDIEPGALNAN
jgi:hypothetical protein